MTNYDDFKKLLFPHNFNGTNDGLSETSTVPGEPLTTIGGDYIVTYSFFKSYSDITLSDYYAANSEEAQKFIDGLEYQQNIEDNLRGIMSPSTSTDPRYVWFQDVANITFSEASIGINDLDGSGSIDQPNEYTTGHIAIGQLEDDSYSIFSGGATAVSLPYNPTLFPDNPEIKHGDIFFNSNNSFWDDPITFKSQQHKVLLEEVLHSLGVDSRTIDAQGTYLNNQKYSVAAYEIDYAPEMHNIITGTMIAPHNLQIMDIAALQGIYGRNYSAFSGNTDYTLSVMNPSLNDDAFLYTIWDGAGTDTINVSSSTIKAEIDLRQGRFSSIGKDAYGGEINKDIDATTNDPDPGNVAIAYYAIIENATGTAYNDILIGNAWNNSLIGGSGSDKIYGDGVVYDNDAGFHEDDPNEAGDPNETASSNNSGDDYLDGGAGDDNLYGGAGNDVLLGGLGDDGAIYTNETSPIILTVNSSVDYEFSVVDSFGDTDFLSSIEHIYGTSGDGDTLQISLDDVRRIERIDNETYLLGIETTSGDTFHTYLHDFENFQLDGPFSQQPSPVEVALNGGGNVSYTNQHSAVYLEIDQNNDGQISFDVKLQMAVDENEVYFTPNGPRKYDAQWFNTTVGVGDWFAEITFEGQTYYSEVTHKFATIDFQSPSEYAYNSSVELLGDGTINVDFAPIIVGDGVVLDGAEMDFNFSWDNDDIPYIDIGQDIYTGFFDWESDWSDYSNASTKLEFTYLDENATSSNAYFSVTSSYQANGISYIPTFEDLTNTKPIANDDVFVFARGASSVTENVLNNDFDADFDPLSVLPGTYTTESGGSVSIDNTGQFFYDPLFEYGNDKFEYMVLDGQGGYDTAEATISVSNKFAPIAVDDSFTQLQGQLISGDLLTNDIELNGDIIAIPYSSFTTANGGTVTIFSDIMVGSFEYMPADGFYGIDTFDYTVSNDLFSDTATVTLNIEKGDDPSEYADQLFGTTSGDLINGMNGNDNIYAYAGDDILHGGGGNDIISPGNGDDTIYAGNGDDLIWGSDGQDTIDGGDGVDGVSYYYVINSVNVDLLAGLASSDGQGQSDTLVSIENIYGSNVANDVLKGNSSANLIYGNGGDDQIHGGDGNDELQASGGNDTVYGDEGDDIIQGWLGNDTLNGGSGTDTLYGYDGDDTLSGGTGNDELQAWYGDDLLYGDAGNDELWGSYGNDAIFGGSGNDDIIGGPGVDVADYSLDPLGVTVNLSSGLGYDGFGFLDTISFTENVNGSIFADVIIGDMGANILSANAGDDVLFGGTGADTLDGGQGNDSVSYAEDTSSVSVNLQTGNAVDGNGDIDILSNIENIIGSDFNDSLIGSNNTSNTINGGSGNDDIRGYTGDDILSGDSGDDVLRGYGGIDTLYGGAGNDSITDLVNSYVDGGADTDTLTLSAEDEGVSINMLLGTMSGTVSAETGTISGIEILYATYFDDIVVGDTFSNNLRGLSGNDDLNGGAGNDTLHGGDGNDILRGGSGIDDIRGGNGIDTIDYSAAASSVNVKLFLSAANDDGDGGSDNLTDIENIRGSSFSDTLYGDDGVNIIYGGDGGDYIYGRGSGDTLYGEAGHDRMFGNDSDDTLYGGADNDKFWGHSGNDILTGGAGLDQFYFLAGDTGIDTITDFSVSDDDRLNIADIVYGFTSGVDDVSEWVHITDDGIDSTLAVDADGAVNGTNFVTIATLANVTGLSDEAALETSGNLVLV